MATEATQVNKTAKAKARNLRVSPRKMRLVTNLVNGMKVDEAVTQLQFANKKAAPMVIKLLQSAVANAVNNFSLNRDSLYIKEITTDMGPVMKRSRPRARGSAFLIRRKMSHVNVVLEERPVKAKSKKATVAPKAAKKAEPVQTKEGSLGKPKEVETKTPKIPDGKEKHRENFDKVVDKKKKPELISQRTNTRTTNK